VKLYADLQRRYLAQQRKMRRLIIELAQYTHSTPILLNSSGSIDQISVSSILESAHNAAQNIEQLKPHLNNDNNNQQVMVSNEPPGNEQNLSDKTNSTNATPYVNRDDRMMQLEWRLRDLENENERLRKEVQEYSLQCKLLSQKIEQLNLDNHTLYEQSNAFRELAEKLMKETLMLDNQLSRKDALIEQKLKNRSQVDLLISLGLSFDDQVVGDFICIWNHKPGCLYVSNYFLVFQATCITDVVSKKKHSSDLKISILSIVSINKIDKSILPLTTKAIEIHICGRVIYTFRGLIRRKELVKIIFLQAEKLNHSIILLREGKTDDKHGLQLRSEDFVDIGISTSPRSDSNSNNNNTNNSNKDVNININPNPSSSNVNDKPTPDANTGSNTMTCQQNTNLERKENQSPRQLPK
jgi:hypothetical protein